MDRSVESLTLSVDRLEELPYVDSSTYASLLRKCGSLRSTELGTRIHRNLIESGRDRDTFLGNLVVDMYGRCGRFDDAQRAFEKIDRKNRFSWNILVGLYAQSGNLQEGRKVFDSMPERDVVTWNTMFGAYAQHGNILEARLLFDKMPLPNVVSWNAMIRAYAHSGHNDEAICMFYTMQVEGFRPNEVTFIVVLDAWGSWQRHLLKAKTRDLDALIVDNGFLADVPVGNALMNLYSRFGKVGEMKVVFDKMPDKDVVTWTTLLYAYAQNGQPAEALALLPRMDLEGHYPDIITFITLAEACGELGCVEQCLRIQKVIDDTGDQTGSITKVGNALVNMYGKCNKVEFASHEFATIEKKDVISWTALITANAVSGHPHKAMRVFKLMDLEGLCLDKVAWISIIDACTSASAISEGRIIHSALEDQAEAIDLEVTNALLSMYAKCGRLDDAVKILDNVPCLDIISWNSIITAFARNGHYTQTLDSYFLMVLEGSCRPNSITFISVLTACSHKGLLKDGIYHFISMIQDYNIEPVIDHYSCMVDLLGRVGELPDAEELLKTMPLAPNEVAWRTLLSSCGTNGDIRRGKHAADRVENAAKMDTQSLGLQHLDTCSNMRKCR